MINALIASTLACANVEAAQNDRPGAAGPKSGYIIVTDANTDAAQADAFASAVNELAKHRNADDILDLEIGLEAVLKKLSESKPRFVAFVVKPERIEDNFVGAVFDGMSNLDDDPQLDTSWGFITGRSGEDAQQMVQNTIAAERKPAEMKKRFVAVAHTFAENDLAPFAVEQGEAFAARGFETAGINPIDDSKEWQAKAANEIQKLNGASLVFFAGHGMGDMSCIIPGDELGKVELNRAVVVNGTCHCAVTVIRHDIDVQTMGIKQVRIDPAKSVCLNLISAGAIAQIGSTAGSCWMNVAPAISGFLDEGAAMGDALRRRLDWAIEQSGVTQVHVLRFREGRPSPIFLGPPENAGQLQSYARVVLIGDPAYVPFPKN